MITAYHHHQKQNVISLFSCFANGGMSLSTNVILKVDYHNRLMGLDVLFTTAMIIMLSTS